MLYVGDGEGGDDEPLQVPNSSYTVFFYFPGGSVVKNLPVNSGDAGSIPGSGRSHEDRNGNSLQYSCLGNPMARGTWQATVHGATKESNTTE